MTWVDSVLKSERQRRLFNRDRVKEEAAIGVYELMEHNGISRAELARRIGRSRSYVTKVLSGSHNVTLETLADLYFAMGRALHFAHSSDPTQLQLPISYDAVSHGDEDVQGITEAGGTHAFASPRYTFFAEGVAAAIGSDLGGLHGGHISSFGTNGNDSVLLCSSG
jgi:transcriptional regulator with XRE-family HTH domain